MSVRDGTLYFAPNVRWEDVDLEDVANFKGQLRQRFEGFYFNSARRLLTEPGSDGIEDFAGGLIVLSAFDAIARLWTAKRNHVRDRFTETFNTFAAKALGSCYEPNWADVVYDQFRNGLVHESRIKRNARFDVNTEQCIVSKNDVWIINPRCLLKITECALEGLIASDSNFDDAIVILREDFATSVSTG